MQAKSKIYLKQFEQDNQKPPPTTSEDVMKWFNQQVITINLDSK